MHGLSMLIRQDVLFAVVAFASLFECSHAILANEAAAAIDAIPLMRRPYQVRLLIALDRESRDSFDQSAFLRDVSQVIHRTAGELWATRIESIDWLGPASAIGLERLTESFVKDRYADDEVDVWFVAAVESRAGGIRVSVRSWQPEVRFETSVQSTEVIDPREMAVALARSCRDLFRPMGVVEQADQQTVQIRLRGGEIVPPDASFAQLQKNDVLMPMFAFRDRNRRIERLQPIPWTFVTVDDVVESAVTGSVRSGLRMSLGGKKRGRIETLVVAVRPQHTSTVLELMTQSKLPLPLAAHRLELRSDSKIVRPNTAESSDESSLLNELLTDRLGLVTIPLEPDYRIVWLFAYSGENLLARVPFVPGLVTRQRLEVPDDSTRLNAESDLQILQGEVIDAVALRNTAFATIRAAAKKDDWTTVNSKLALLKRQQENNTLLDRLNAVRILGTTAAKVRKDRIAEVRINRICDDMLTLINAHLSPDKMRLLVEEMEALQREPANEK